MKYLVAFICIIAFLFSCSDDPTKDGNIIEDKLLLKTWELVKIYPDSSSEIDYDSMKCIENVVYGYINGDSANLSDNVNPEPDTLGFADYRYAEDWTFAKPDSLSIERGGGQPSSWQCIDGSPTLLVAPGYPIFHYNAHWDVDSKNLLVFPDNETTTTYSFVVDSLTNTILILKGKNKTLIFEDE